jgi:SulP family sulfate permease
MTDTPPQPPPEPPPPEPRPLEDFAAQVSTQVRQFPGQMQQGLPAKETRGKDGIAGLVLAFGNLPDAMAAALMMSVPPVQGLYAAVVGPFIGGMTASTQRMIVTTTTAIALSANDVTFDLTGEAKINAIIALALLTGLFLTIAGLLRAGVITRFVSFSVMTGFLSGIAVQIILGQLGRFVGYAATGNTNLAKAIDVLRNLDDISIPSVIVGTLTIILALALGRTRLKSLGRLIGLFVPTIIIVLFGITSVQQVKNVAEIPRGIPLPAPPNFDAVPDDAVPSLITGALAIAVIAMVQSAGVSQGTPNLDGKPRNVSRDFAAQGLANIASSLFQGVPIGGTVSNTALAVSAGSRTRWTAIFSALFMLSFLLLIPGVVSQIAMPSLAALLILAGIGAIKIDDARWVWKTNNVARATITVTFISTMFFPVQVAVAIGAALSAVLYVNQASFDVTLVERKRLSDGRRQEDAPPANLPSHAITELEVYGSLFYAGARTFQEKLPKVGNAKRPIVILRLRGITRIGATFIDVLANYADELREVNGSLFLVGVDQGVYEQVIRTGKLDEHHQKHLLRFFVATKIVGESTDEAYKVAQAILDAAKDEQTDKETDEQTDEQADGNA